MSSIVPSVLVLAAASATVASAQTLGPDFVNDYVVGATIPTPVPLEQGGMCFKAGDPDTLLVIGDGETPAATIYELPVVRDAQGHVIDVGSTFTVFATAPYADAGLRYGPGGVLFYTTYNTNTLGQIKPGSTSPDRVIDLTALGVSPSVGGLDIVPAGFPGAGQVKLTSYNADQWYSGDLVPDGNGTYDLVNVALRAQFGPFGPESAFYVDASYPRIDAPSVVVCNWFVETIVVYEVDANGDPLPATGRDLVECCGYWSLGSTLDPVTGDFLFCDWGSGVGIAVVERNVGPLGTSYCSPAVANSTGQPGVISANGSPVASANDVTLTADQLPASSFGFFLTSRTQGFVAGPGGSQGDLCLGGSIGRYVGPGQIQNTGATGSISLALDLVMHPTPTGFVTVQPGETWHFQCWHRDGVGGVATSNFTSGLTIDFL